MKTPALVSVLVSLMAGLALLFASETKLPSVREGDIVFSGSARGRGAAIRAATGSDYTHCGIVFQKDGTWMVLEAVQPVRAVSLEKFYSRSKGGLFTVRRLKTPLTPDAMAKGREWATEQVGKDYDPRFLWGDDAMYCSELVWKAFQHAGVELCKPRQFKDYHLDDPKVRKDIEQQFGSVEELPREEKVVAPSDLASSPLLMEIK